MFLIQWIRFLEDWEQNSRIDTDTGAAREEETDENISVEMCNSIDDILNNIAKGRK